MAVVRLRYIGNRNQLKAHLRYIIHRKGDTQEKITRPQFFRDGPTEKQSSYRMIDEAPRGAVFYKFMINPDPRREDRLKDLDLEHITRVTLAKLERQLARRLLFAATIHDDHTDKRHIHGIFLLGKRVPKETFNALAKAARQAATEEALLQRKGLDRARAHPRLRLVAASLRSVRAKAKGRGGRVPRYQPGCRSCGYGELTGIPGNRVYCPMCHTRLKKDRELSFEREAHS